MPLTLVEAAKLETGNVIRQGVIEQFARESNILRVLPFEDISGNALRYNREEQLPGIAFRGVNEGYAESVGVINPQTESLFIAGGDLDVDRFIINTMGPGQREAHEAMKIKSLSAAWTSCFLKGDTTVQPRQFDGLQNRLVGTQLIEAGNTSGGDALSLEVLDAAIDSVSNPTHIITNRALKRKFTGARKNIALGGNITLEKDDFGRPVESYGGLPILTTWGDVKMTDPLTFTETGAGGGAAVSTSIYVVSMGAGSLVGIQNGGLSVRDLGELDALPLYRTRVEWYAGIAIFDASAAVRIRGIKNATFVA